MRTNRDLKLANLPHCDWRTFLRFTGPDGTIPQKDVEALDHYFQHFLPPGPCIKCGHQQGVDKSDFLALIRGEGRFRFGIQHGEGQCITGGCGWPARAIHYNIGPIQKLEMILQYHPAIVTWEEDFLGPTHSIRRNGN